MNVNCSSKEFEGQFTYFGNDLGCICTDSETRFRAWAPTAKQVTIRFYQSGVPAPDESYTEVHLDCIILFHADWESTTIALPEGRWYSIIDKEKAGLERIAQYEDYAAVSPACTLMLIKE